ncbi:hypothetical protein ACFLZV_02425 [Candidatus Margulisiibacteriota bacterium]
MNNTNSKKINDAEGNNTFDLINNLFNESKAEYYLFSNINQQKSKSKQYYVFKLWPTLLELVNRTPTSREIYKYDLKTMELSINDEAKAKDYIQEFKNTIDMVIKDVESGKVSALEKPISAKAESEIENNQEVTKTLESLNRTTVMKGVKALSQSDIAQIIGGAIHQISFIVNKPTGQLPIKPFSSKPSQKTKTNFVQVTSLLVDNQELDLLDLRAIVKNPKLAKTAYSIKIDRKLISTFKKILKLVKNSNIISGKNIDSKGNVKVKSGFFRKKSKVGQVITREDINKAKTRIEKYDIKKDNIQTVANSYAQGKLKPERYKDKEQLRELNVKEQLRRDEKVFNSTMEPLPEIKDLEKIKALPDKEKHTLPIYKKALQIQKELIAFNKNEDKITGKKSKFKFDIYKDPLDTYNSFRKTITAQQKLLGRVTDLFEKFGEFFEEKDGKNDWHKAKFPKTSILLHGGRICFDLPPVKKGENPHLGLEKLVGIPDSIKDQGKRLEYMQKVLKLMPRDAATHDVKIKKGKIKEVGGMLVGIKGIFKRGVQVVKNFFRKIGGKKVDPYESMGSHYGADITVGGVINKKTGKIQLPDGSRGHLYAFYKAPTTKSPGAVLFGIEGSRPVHGIRHLYDSKYRELLPKAIFDDTIHDLTAPSPDMGKGGTSKYGRTSKFNVGIWKHEGAPRKYNIRVNQESMRNFIFKDQRVMKG